MASVSPEWALKIKGESICADCLRILQIEMDAQNPPGPLYGGSEASSTLIGFGDEPE